MSLAPEAAGCMRMTLTDDNAVCIENYQSIVEYTQKRVRVHIGAYDILVRGTQLVLQEFGIPLFLFKEMPDTQVGNRHIRDFRPGKESREQQ